MQRGPQKVENCVFTKGQQLAMETGWNRCLCQRFGVFGETLQSQLPVRLTVLTESLFKCVYCGRVCISISTNNFQKKKTKNNTINESKANSLSAPRKSLLRTSGPVHLPFCLDCNPGTSNPKLISIFPSYVCIERDDDSLLCFPFVLD